MGIKIWSFLGAIDVSVIQVQLVDYRYIDTYGMV